MICVLMWRSDTTVTGNSSLHLLVKEHWYRCRRVGTPLSQRVWFVHCILVKIRLFKEKSSPLLPTVSLKLTELLSPHPLLCHCVGLVFLLNEGARPTHSVCVLCSLCSAVGVTYCFGSLHLLTHFAAEGSPLHCSIEQWDSARGV